MKIVHVCGTPASGKPCLSELLRDYYHEKGTKVFLLTDWTNLNGVDPWGSLSKLVKSWGPDPGMLSPTSNVVIRLENGKERKKKKKKKSTSFCYNTGRERNEFKKMLKIH